jgi:hypothetical protein
VEYCSIAVVVAHAGQEEMAWSCTTVLDSWDFQAAVGVQQEVVGHVQAVDNPIAAVLAEQEQESLERHWTYEEIGHSVVAEGCSYQQCPTAAPGTGFVSADLVEKVPEVALGVFDLAQTDPAVALAYIVPS